MATEVEQRIAALETKMEDLAAQVALHERRQEGEFKAITDKLDTIYTIVTTTLASRPPVWATLMLTGMGTIIGILVGVVATHSMR